LTRDCANKPRAFSSGLTRVEIQQRHPLEYARYRSAGSDYIIPGGESAAQRAALVVNCF